jgi:hypothetical protein
MHLLDGLSDIASTQSDGEVKPARSQDLASQLAQVGQLPAALSQGRGDMRHGITPTEIHALRQLSWLADPAQRGECHAGG